MTQRSLVTPNCGLRVFNATLLSALLIMMPFVQMAAASRRASGIGNQGPESTKQAADSGNQGRATNAAAENVFLNAPVPKPAPEPLAAVIAATKHDGLAAAATVAPDGIITYTVNVSNSGGTSATNVQFSDQIDAHTTLVAGSPVAAGSDRYETIGNVQLSIPDGPTDLLGNDFDPDSGTNAGMTVTAETKSSTNCTGTCSNNVTINADGGFTYNPPVGFSGTDTFTYTAQSGTSTVTQIATITVANEIWFIKNAGAVGGACSSNCDGRLSNPFPSLAAFNGVNDGTAGHPGVNDWIFVFESSTDYAGPAVLLSGQKFIGQDATASLIALTNFAQPSGTDLLPVMNSGNGTFVNITGANANGIALNSANTLRGFRVGNVGTGTKISGLNFGTLVVGDSASPDVLLHGTGQALSLNNGTLSNAGGFISVTSTSSAGAGINLAGVADSDANGAGFFSFGSTTISNSTTQGILIGTTPADLNFGNTSVTGGTNAISLQNNSAGTRTFGTLTTSGASAESFLHAIGGGNVTVTGAATLSSAGSAISVSSPTINATAINFQGATSATTTGATVTAVNWVGTAGTSMTFNSLSITRNNGTALNATGAGTINVTNGTGSITNTTPGGPAIVATNITLNANFSSINSTGGDNGVILTTVSGTSNLGGGQLTGTSGGSTFLISGGSCSVTYSGNITQSTIGPMVTVTGGHASSGPVTFSGTLIASLGTGMQFNNADSTVGGYNFTGTTTLGTGVGGDAGLDIFGGSAGTFVFGTGTSINNPSGIAYREDTSTANVTYNGTITKNNNADHAVDINAKTGGTTAFNGAITASTTTVNAIDLTNTGGVVNFTGGLNLTTTSGIAFNASGSGATINATQNNTTIVNTLTSTTGAALNVANTTIGVSGLTFRSINVTGNNTLPASGIILSATGANGLTVTGNGGACTPATPTCSGGTIQGTGSHGISFTNVSNIVFNVFRIHNTGDHGIFGDGVNNLTWRDSYIHDFGNTAGAGVSEDAMHFESTNLANTAAGHGLTGTVIIQRNTFGPDSAFTRTPNPPLPENKGIVVRNHNDANLTMTVTGTKFTQISNDGLDIDIRNETSTAGGIGTATLNVDGSTADGTNTFDNINGRSINFVQPVDNAAARVYELTIKNNTFNSVGIGGRWMASARGTMNARYNNNTMTSTSDDSIRSESDAVNAALSPKATVNATVSNNNMGGGSIFISLHRQALTSMTFTNNSNIGGTPAGAGGCATCLGVHTGVNLRSDRGSALGIDFQGNTGTADGSLTFAQSALDMVASDNGGGPSSICANVGGAGALKNTLTENPDTAGQQVISIDPAHAGTTITIEGGTGGSPATENFLIANNTLNGVNKVAISAPSRVPSGVGANCVTSVLVQNAPASPRDYLVRADQLFQNEIPVSSGFFFVDTKDSARAALEILNRSAQTTSLSNDGQTASVLAKVVIDSALNSALMAPTALAHSAEVTSQRSEVSDQKSEIRTHHAPSSKLETGHTTREEESGLRAHYATLSKLVTPSASAAPAPMVDIVTANIGTLPAGGSVNITFQVKVNNPPNLSLLSPPRVENQGTVTADGGITVLTDDTEPALAGSADKTATQIDLYGTTTTVQTNGTPSAQGDPVVFTATVAPDNLPFAPPGGTNPAGTVQFLDGATPITCNEGSTSTQTLNASSQATCTTSTLGGGAHTINVNYSGNGNFDSSVGNVAQNVIPCTTNPVVTTTADSGAGSLREALANVCTGTTITFDTAGVFANPQTILLTGTELTVGRSVTIDGPDAAINHVTVNGDSDSRVFNVNSGKTVTIRDLTITNGSATGNGGGILNQGTLTLINVTVSGSQASIGGGGLKNDGTLTLKNSTVSGNNATQNGAGIDNSSVLNIVNSTISGNISTIDGGGLVQDGVSAILYMVNSTISGNTANGYGGGLDLRSGTATVLNSTITGNHGDNDNGSGGGAGGLRQQTAAVTIRNTIVAGNYIGSGTAAPNDIDGTVSGNNNLIGDAGSAGGLTHNVNGNIVGAVIANVLDTVLANNGGPTKTHRLITGSAALDAGEDGSLPTDVLDADSDGNMGEPLGVDQRGQPRVVDNPNVPNAVNGLDIGAYEAPAPPSTPDLDAASDTGGSSTDNYTSDNTPTFTIGGVSTGDTVHLLRNGTSVANAVAAGSTIQLTDPAAPDGTHTYSARRIVAGGTSPDSTGLSVTIDTGAPGAPTIDLVAASDSGNNSDDITNAATRTFDIGNTETGATVELLRGGVPVVGSSTTGNGGTVQLSDSDVLVSGTTYAYTARQTDGGGNQTSSSTLNVVFDNVSPTVNMTSAATNSTNTSPIPVTVTFSENVTGFTAGDIVAGNAVVNNFAGGPAVYTFDLVPAGQGLVTADISAGVAQDTAGNDNTAATQFSRTYDTAQPSANVTDVTPDPRNTSVSSITIVFSEAVVNFELADLTLTRDGNPVTLTGTATLNTADNITWTLGNLSTLTGTAGTYLLTVPAAGSGITDNAGNGLQADATDTWVVDTTGPAVTINQASGQVDPTSASPINFTVVFNEPVTGFTNTDVSFSGAGATTATVTEVAPNNGTTYNVAISGMNADGTVQATVNVNAAQDGAGNNSAASTSTDNQVSFISAITINIHDATVAEPASPNTVDMTFTVALSSPASGGGVSVNFTTNDGSAISGSCGTAGVDFNPTSGTVNFIAGEQVKTINVPVCSDNASEGDETFTVTLSNPTAPGVIGDGTATGTITAATPAATLLISELRTSGPAGSADDFVEIYNNTNAAITVPAGGYGLFKKGADCNGSPVLTASPVLVGIIPQNTVIPARGHFLFVGSAYSLAGYPGGQDSALPTPNPTTATGDATLISDIETDANVGLFSTADVSQISTVNRLDAVGFGINVGGTCNLLREGSPLPSIAGNATLEHSYFRKMCDWIHGLGCTVSGVPKDTNQNSEDFWLADTEAVTGRLGAPGPENRTSPIRRDNSGVNVFMLDGNVGATAQPNRSRDTTPGSSPVTFGTMTLRRRVINNTGSPVTRLRYRIVDISTAVQPVGGVADLRALSDPSTPSIGPITDGVTCTAAGAGSPPCTVTVFGTTLETPPTQPNGGGYNSTLASGTVTIATPLANGASIPIQFKLGVNKTGTFRFYIIVEALP